MLTFFLLTRRPGRLGFLADMGSRQFLAVRFERLSFVSNYRLGLQGLQAKSLS